MFIVMACAAGALDVRQHRGGAPGVDRWSGESEQPGLGTAEPEYVGVSGCRGELGRARGGGCAQTDI